MENAVDALKMAAAVMIFVLALSISITAFSEARIASTTLLDYTDREFFLGNDDYYNSTTKKRTVGIETIIPAIYKAYSDESYKIVFLKNGEPEPEPIVLYELKRNDEPNKEINTMGLVYDMSNELGLSSNKYSFIERILYGPESVDDKDLESLTKKANNSVEFKKEKFFERFAAHNYEESSGVYYQEEENGKSNSPNANKYKIRVITYKEI